MVNGSRWIRCRAYFAPCGLGIHQAAALPVYYVSLELLDISGVDLCYCGGVTGEYWRPTLIILRIEVYIDRTAFSPIPSYWRPTKDSIRISHGEGTRELSVSVSNSNG